MKLSAILLMSVVACTLFIGCTNPDAIVQLPSVQHETAAIPEISAAVEVPPEPEFDPLSVDVVLDQEPSGDEPVAIAAALDRAEAKIGDTVTLVVRMKVDSAWHSYAVSGPTGVAMPTKLELELPAGIRANSDWQYPEATMMDSIEGEIAAYVGDLRFAIPLVISDPATSGTTEIQCEIRYQACNHESCLPPDKKTLTVSLNVK